MILLIILLFTTQLLAQEYNFIKHDVKDGLALSQISKLEKYSDGRLIVSTYGGGFNIYDGQNFHLFNTTNGLAYGNIYCFALQNDTLLWIGTEKGLSQFDGSRINNYYKEDGLPSELITALFASIGTATY